MFWVVQPACRRHPLRTPGTSPSRRFLTTASFFTGVVLVEFGGIRLAEAGNSSITWGRMGSIYIQLLVGNHSNYTKDRAQTIPIILKPSQLMCPMP